MSIDRAAVEADRSTNGVAIVALGAGTLLLLVRPWIASLPHASVLLFVSYAGLGALALAPPVPSGAGPVLPVLGVAAGGVAAVAVAAALAGPAVPLVVSGWTVPLNVTAAVAEEAMFRRLLFGLLEPAGVAAAVMVTAVAFALIHVPFYGPAAFWADLGAGLLLGWQRWASGGWAAPAATHAFANLLAVLR